MANHLNSRTAPRDKQQETFAFRVCAYLYFMQMRLLVFLAFLTVIPVNANAINFGGTLGFYQPMIGHLQDTTSERNTGFFGDFSLSVFLDAGTFDLIGTNHFLPEIGYVFLSTPDANSTNQFYLNADIATELIGNFLWVRYGLGFNVIQVGGDGGAVTRRNGSSFTTAYQPSDSATSFVSSLNLGLQSNFFETGGVSGGLRINGYILGLLNGDARQLNLHISAVVTFL